jgi:hypothetical protein
VDPSTVEHVRSHLLRGLGYAQQFPQFDHAFGPFQLRNAQLAGVQQRREPSYAVGVSEPAKVPMAVLKLAQVLVNAGDAGKELICQLCPQDFLFRKDAGGISAGRECWSSSFLMTLRLALDRAHMGRHGEAVSRLFAALTERCGEPAPLRGPWTLPELMACNEREEARSLLVHISSCRHQPAQPNATNVKDCVVLNVSGGGVQACDNVRVVVPLDKETGKHNWKTLQALPDNGKGARVLMRSVCLRGKPAPGSNFFVLELRGELHVAA